MAKIILTGLFWCSLLGVIAYSLPLIGSFVILLNGGSLSLHVAKDGATSPLELERVIPFAIGFMFFVVLAITFGRLRNRAVSDQVRANHSSPA